MQLKTVFANYQKGKLIFRQPDVQIQNGSEVVVAYIEKRPTQKQEKLSILKLLRGRGKGEDLVGRLLLSRQEDKGL